MGDAVDPGILLDPATWPDPFRAYRQIRPHSPVEVRPSVWAVLRYPHVQEVLSHPKTFSSNLRDSDSLLFRKTPLLFDDPPRHDRLRALVSGAFMPRQLVDVAPPLEKLARELLDDIGYEPAEFVSRFAEPVPVRTIGQLLGVPESEQTDMRRWSNDRAYLSSQAASGAEDPDALERGEAGLRSLDAYFHELVRRRRARAGADLLSALIDSEIDGDRMDDDEIAAVCAFLLAAGNLTTTNLITSVLGLLCERPGLFARLRREPDLIEPVIEETVRLDGPVQVTFRKAARDVKLGGRTIPAGSRVLVYPGAANRDPEIYDDPDEFRLHRGGRHLGFGYGVHFCIGARLARLETAVSIRALLHHCSEIAHAGVVTRSPNQTSCGFSRMELVCRPH